MPLSAVFNNPGLSLTAPVNAPFLCPKRADIAASPLIVPQLISTNCPFTEPLSFFSSYILLASKDFPAPVGPVRRIGCLVREATSSILSISSLNFLFFVSIPDFRKAISSFNFLANLAAILSYFERSRSIIE